MLTIAGKAKDLGDNFHVRRVLPSARIEAPGRRMVGPFIFFDHMGPATFAPGQRFDVRPHPHIGLATVTYLFDGEIMHRDSLGSEQAIEPGAVNWMIAGRGIVHSERTSEDKQASGQRMEGIQAWVAFPDGHEEDAPAFHHHPADSLPSFEWPGVSATLIAGTAYGETSPVRYPGGADRLVYLAAELEAGATMPLPAGHPEMAVYVVDGSVSVGGAPIERGTMAVLQDETPDLTGTSAARIMILGGTSPGERHIWWNFVSPSAARIHEAARDWRDGRFPKLPNDNGQAIDLPEDRPMPKV
ncbi:MAG: pirin family protein [Pseudomonadota bacterium]